MLIKITAAQIIKMRLDAGRGFPLLREGRKGEADADKNNSSSNYQDAAR